MIVTPLVEEILKMYGIRILGRELTVDEKRSILNSKGHRIEFARNLYYRKVNEIIEEEVKKIGGVK